MPFNLAKPRTPIRIAPTIAFASALLAVSLTPTAASAQNLWQQEIDFDLLLADEGANIADGTGLHVTQVEAPENGHYAPSLSDGSFAGKTLTLRSGNTGGSSNHAGNVGRYYFGKGGFNQVSLAPEINNIDLYSFSGWNGSGYLQPSGLAAPPPVSPNLSRVATHAYNDATSNDRTKRIDYLIETDDFIQVVFSDGGSATSTVDGFGAAFNTIAVGRFDGTNAGGGTSPVFGYPDGRHKPDLVATHGASDSIGIVGGASALLISLGADASLSNGSYVGPRTGLTLQHAQTSESVKAALMAGANRTVTADEDLWSGSPITDYRASATNQTANGLDGRYGAGRLNINKSHKIIQGGEQDSLEDTPLTAGTIGAFGFDYDDSFGGAALSNATASYRFATVADGGRLTSTLAWNVPIDYDTDGSFTLTSTPDFNQLELLLFDVTPLTGDTLNPVASSSSIVDNTQTIWQELDGDREFLLQVRAIDGQLPFSQDYSLAWQIDGWAAPSEVPEPGTLAALLAGLALASTRRRRW